MHDHLVTRQLLSLSLLAALLSAGAAALAVLGLPVPIVAGLALAVVLAQYLLGPVVVRWLVPAREVPQGHDGRYDSELPLARLVERRCADAGLRLVRLGVVDDGTPNAFTFGRSRRDATVYVTRGLLERLDERELDAVVSHEIGHVRQADFVVMTLAAAVPMVLYFVHLSARTQANQNTAPIAFGSWVGYLVAQLAVLSLSRARELSADRWSCRVTGDGDALCSALVKIAYGMGEVDVELARLAREAKQYDGVHKAELDRVRRRSERVRAAGALGIADPAQGGTAQAAREQGLDPREVVGALRWDVCNPWARVQQLLSTHPLVPIRIASLEASGLPGAPTGWRAGEVAASCQGPDLARARRRFAVELLVRCAPLTAFVVAVLAWRTDRGVLAAQAVVALGVALLARAALRTPLTGHVEVDRVTSLLTRLDASPVSGLPVSVRGRVIGRGAAGHVLSPDLVVQDGSGFLAVDYRQPWPYARSFFGLFRVWDWVDRDVVVDGWYRRAPAPVLELRTLRGSDDRRVRGWTWRASWLVGPFLAAVGGLLWLAQVA